MSKKYTQLTVAERYHIYTMKKQGYSNTKKFPRYGARRLSGFRVCFSRFIRAISSLLLD